MPPAEDKGAKGRMDSFEFNKVVGAFLGTVFVVFSVAIISDAIFAAPHPEREGFIIEAVEAEGGEGPTAPTEEPIAVLLAHADPVAGEAAHRRCVACHTVEKGGANKVGPNLWDIINRPIASHEGFSYSGAMREYAQGGAVVWDYDHMNDFLLSPKGLIRGTAMGFAGVRNPTERANLIAYLRTLSDNPAPLPEAPAPTTEAAAPADAETPVEPAVPAPTQATPSEAAPAPAETTPAPTEASPAPTAPAPTETAPVEAAPAPTEPAPAQ